MNSFRSRITLIYISNCDCCKYFTWLQVSTCVDVCFILMPKIGSFEKTRTVSFLDLWRLHVLLSVPIQQHCVQIRPSQNNANSAEERMVLIDSFRQNRNYQNIVFFFCVLAPPKLNQKMLPSAVADFAVFCFEDEHSGSPRLGSRAKFNADFESESIIASRYRYSARSRPRI